jgi:hypothetical protein
MRPAGASGRSSTLFTTLKMAVVAAMPTASVNTTTTVKPGFCVYSSRDHTTMEARC